MSSLQVVAVALVSFGGLVALLNWLSLILTWYTGRFCSAVPLIGAAFLSGGMLLIPDTRPYAWVGVVADYGTLAFLLALPRIIEEIWSTSRYNLIEEYVGDRGIKTVYLRLFHKKVFTIEQRFRRQVGECGVVGAGTIGKWERQRGRLLLHRGNNQAAEFEILATNEVECLRQVFGFLDFEKSGDLSLADIELRICHRRGQSG